MSPLVSQIARRWLLAKAGGTDRKKIEELADKIGLGKQARTWLDAQDALGPLGVKAGQSRRKLVRMGSHIRRLIDDHKDTFLRTPRVGDPHKKRNRVERGAFAVLLQGATDEERKPMRAAIGELLHGTFGQTHPALHEGVKALSGQLQKIKGKLDGVKENLHETSRTHRDHRRPAEWLHNQMQETQEAGDFEGYARHREKWLDAVKEKEPHHDKHTHDSIIAEFAHLAEDYEPTWDTFHDSFGKLKATRKTIKETMKAMAPHLKASIKHFPGQGKDARRMLELLGDYKAQGRKIHRPPHPSDDDRIGHADWYEKFLVDTLGEQGGKTLVYNTNPKSKDSHPKVEAWTLLRTDRSYRRYMDKEFEEWTSKKTRRK